MITAITTMVGVFVFIVGIVWSLLQWFSKPSGQQIIKAVDALTPGDLAKYVDAIAQKPSANRIEALQHADALMTYFEKTKNSAGQSAIASVVSAVFSGGEVK
jgi:hypothetical protein